MIWVKTDIAVVKRRMEERNSPRDKWKLDNWEEYLATCDFFVPGELDVLDDDGLFVFHNSNDMEFHDSMARVSVLLENR